MSIVPLQDTINKKQCEVNPHQGCSALEHIAPIYFAIFVLATQFVLLNVVVAVLMKHLEEAKDNDKESLQEDQVTAAGTLEDSSKDIRPSKSSLRVPVEKQRKVSFGDCSEDGRIPPESEANNNAECSAKTGSESSLSSREIDKVLRPRQDSDLLRRLPPIDKSDNISLRSTGSASLAYHPFKSKPPQTRSEKIESTSVPELGSPQPQQMEVRERQLSPRAPIYHLSEDSDWYDSVIEFENGIESTQVKNWNGHASPSDGLESLSSGDEGQRTGPRREGPGSADKVASSPEQNAGACESQSRAQTPYDTQNTGVFCSGSASPKRWASPVGPSGDQHNGDVEMMVIKPPSAKRKSQSENIEDKNQSYV